MPRRSVRNLIIEACTFIIPLLTTISPPLVCRAQRQEEVTRLVVPFLLLLVVLQIPTPDELLPLMQRLDPSFHGYNFRGRNVFEDVENQRYLFWLNTGELPQTMLAITAKISRNLLQVTRRGGNRQRTGRFKLNDINMVLLTFMWIRKYPCLDTLALLFDVSPSTVSNIIHSVVPVLWRFFHNQVLWPSIEEWNALRGNWPSFPDAVGCIDGTPHKIFRPQVEPQRQFYSGHRHYHLMNTQLIVDNVGNIVFLQAGFLGAQNDAVNYLLMERIGPGTNHDMPPSAVIDSLSHPPDKAYGDTRSTASTNVQQTSIEMPDYCGTYY